MERKVLYSDLSGEMIQGPEDHAIVTVTSHPDLEQPVRLDARPSELAQLGELSIEAVSLQVEQPDEEPTVHILPIEKFNELAGEGMEMEAILAGATPAVVSLAARRRNHNRRSDGGPLINYGDPEYAGMPHKGKIGDDEKRIVQQNLEEVNARLTAQGVRTIDPANPEHAERYGLSIAAISSGDESVEASAQSPASQQAESGDEQADTRATERPADGTEQDEQTEADGSEDSGSTPRRRRSTRR